MGWNTAVVVMNDCLNDIKNDPKFGEKLYKAILKYSNSTGHIDVAAGCCINAATVVGHTHSSGYLPVLVGGNYGKVIADIYVSADSKEDAEIQLLKGLAHKYGFYLHRKRKNRV